MLKKDIIVDAITNPTRTSFDQLAENIPNEIELFGDKMPLDEAARVLRTLSRAKKEVGDGNYDRANWRMQIWYPKPIS